MSAPAQMPYAEPANPAPNIRQAKRAGKKHASPYQEYVSAGGPYWYANSLASLPHPIDDVTLDFGDDLYSRLCYDAQIASLVNLFKTGIAADGLTFTAAVPEEDDDHDAAKELADWCTWVIDQLEHSIDEVLWDLMDAMPYGNRVAELVYEHGTGPDGTTQVLLKKIAPKPRRMTAFVVDGFNNLVGLLGQIPGQTFYVQTSMIVDPGELPNFLDRERFAVLTFRSRDGDPRGVSLLRPAYGGWYVKKQIEREYLKYLGQFANPFLIGYTANDLDQDTGLDEDGNPLPSPETAMVTQLSTVKNSTALAFPFGAKVDVVKSEGNGEAHLLGIDLQNREMAKAITSQTLATEEGKHQTRASSGTHQDVLDMIVRPGKRLVERMIARDILTPLIVMNFGKKALELLPKPTLGRTEQHDFAAMATAIAALKHSGYLHDSQLPLIDVMQGLPVRDLSMDPLAAAPAPSGEPADPNAQPAQQGQPAPSTQPPVDPEKQAAQYIAVVAKAAALRQAQLRAAEQTAIRNWTGHRLRYWLSERPAA